MKSIKRFAVSKTKKAKSLEGQLLVASPKISDPKFFRAVILVLHHGNNGAMGVVLNRPLPTNAPELWDFVGDAVTVGDDRAHFGGPLSGSITVLHNVANTSRSPQGRIYVLEKCDQLEKLLGALQDESFRFFVGHAGWEKGQLEAELESGAWLSVPASPTLVFGDKSDLWLSAMRELSLSFYQDVLKLRHIPEDPQLN